MNTEVTPEELQQAAAILGEMVPHDAAEFDPQPQCDFIVGDERCAGAVAKVVLVLSDITVASDEEDEVIPHLLWLCEGHFAAVKAAWGKGPAFCRRAYNEHVSMVDDDAEGVRREH